MFTLRPTTKFHWNLRANGLTRIPICACSEWAYKNTNRHSDVKELQELEGRFERISHSVLVPCLYIQLSDASDRSSFVSRVTNFRRPNSAWIKQQLTWYQLGDLSQIITVQTAVPLANKRVTILKRSYTEAERRLKFQRVTETRRRRGA
jgi:hypothetical protein